MAVTLYTTADNSHTLYNAELDETYHSRNGAVEESLYVFLKQGFDKAIEHKKELSLLEVGLGTGLNAILTLIQCHKTTTVCHYHALETYPLPIEVIDSLNYDNFISPPYQCLFPVLHKTDWDRAVVFNGYFTLTKLKNSIHTYTPEGFFDVIYFDAFGPDKQPDMWTIDVFKKLYACMNDRGVMVTYSAKGDVRRALKEVGFTVELLPGPPRKRHMIRATKIA